MKCAELIKTFGFFGKGECVDCDYGFSGPQLCPTYQTLKEMEKARENTKKHFKQSRIIYNLYKEMLREFEKIGKTEEDVDYVTSTEGSASWNEFKKLVDFSYRTGIIEMDIVFNDKTWLNRKNGHINGSKWSFYKSPEKTAGTLTTVKTPNFKPYKRKEIKNKNLRIGGMYLYNTVVFYCKLNEVNTNPEIMYIKDVTGDVYEISTTDILYRLTKNDEETHIIRPVIELKTVLLGEASLSIPDPLFCDYLSLFKVIYEESYDFLTVLSVNKKTLKLMYEKCVEKLKSKNDNTL